MQQSREKGGSKPLSYLCSNRKILVDDFREMMLLLGSTGRKCIFPYLPWGRIAVFSWYFLSTREWDFMLKKENWEGRGSCCRGEGRYGCGCRKNGIPVGRTICLRHVKYASGILTDGIRGSLRAWWSSRLCSTEKLLKAESVHSFGRRVCSRVLKKQYFSGRAAPTCSNSR